MPDTILFLSSDTLPGLSISYSVDKGIFYGGLPLMASKKIEIIDNNIHQLSYAFNSQTGVQSLYLDGQMLVEDKYIGNVDLVTGMMIYSKKEYVESSIDINIRVE